MVNVTEPLEKETWDVSEQCDMLFLVTVKNLLTIQQNWTLWQMILSVKDTD